MKFIKYIKSVYLYQSIIDIIKSLLVSYVCVNTVNNTVMMGLIFSGIEFRNIWGEKAQQIHKIMR